MKYLNPQGAPRSWCNAIRDVYDLDSDLTTITVSGIHLPPKIRLLTIRHSDEIEVDVVDQAHALFGEAFHYVITKAQDDTYIAEKRIMAIVQGKVFTGKPDLYDKLDNIIEDYKTASVWTYIFNKDDWERKLNCYAWLERTVCEREVKGLLAVVYFKDWRRSELLRNDQYPKCNLLWFSPRLWRQSDQKHFIESHIRDHKRCEIYPDDEIPVCLPRERWADNDVYAVHKVVKGELSKRAVNARCATKQRATEVMEELYLRHGKKDQYVISYRPGLDKRCVKYCNVNKFCNYYKGRYDNETQGNNSALE